jgi:hypothetical protein
MTAVLPPKRMSGPAGQSAARTGRARGGRPGSRQGVLAEIAARRREDVAHELADRSLRDLSRAATGGPPHP